MHWPNRVWEMGDISPEGKQLWSSREPTKEDKERRRKFEFDYQMREIGRGHE